MSHPVTWVAATSAIVSVAYAASAQESPTGLQQRERGACAGYTLFSPLRSAKTYLIDMQGNVVHSWKSDAPPGQTVYLLDNGHLLRCEHTGGNRAFHGGGIGGRIRQFDWDGNVVWGFVYSNSKHCQHHDIEPLPNGNVLVLAWESKTRAEAIAAGRDPELTGREGLWPDHIIEVKPSGSSGGTIVWEWHVWDHLIQDYDSTKANYGKVAEHPELIDINYAGGGMRLSREQRMRLESLGYLPPSPNRRPRGGHADWNHTNSIDYNAELDQIILSVLSFNEVWIIDHGTTTKEAAGHAGGKHGKGGDLLYRWGNPKTYRAGTPADQQLFAQHDARWIPPGHPGAGHVLIFNNGRGRPGGDHSSVDEIVLPLDAEGRYARKPGTAFGPARPVWSYTSPRQADFFAGHISGAQRLPNGNTLICSGEQGQLFEVNAKGKTVWKYVSPFRGDIRPPGPGGRPDGPWGRFRPPPHEGADPSGRTKRERRFDGPPPGPPRGLGAMRHPPRRPPPGGHDRPNALFRATRLSPDSAGLEGKDLTQAAAR